MKELLANAVRDAAKCLCDRMSVLKNRALCAAERGQEVRFSVLMGEVDSLADELVSICAAGAALGLTRAEMMPSAEGGAA